MARRPLPTLLAALLLGAVLAGAGARVCASLSRAHEPPADTDGREYRDAAANLRRGVLSFDDAADGPLAPGTRRGPLFPAALALFPERPGDGPAAFFWRAQAAFGAALALLGAALGLLAAGPLAGLAAGAVAALDPLARHHAGTLHVQLFFGSLVALVGLALLRWGRRPTPANAALAGLAVGATLLTRSTLAPFLLFLPAWLALSPQRPKDGARQAALFCAAALVLLLPWLLRNRLLLGRWQPFEQGTLEYVLVAGASGAVSDDFAERPGHAASADVTPADAGRQRRGPAAAVAEAGRRAAAAPGTALAAVVARLPMWGWGLLAWAPAALLLRRARGEDLALWALGGLAVFWNVHLFLLGSMRHFIPALAPLAALAAAGVFPRAPKVSPALASALGALPWLAPAAGLLAGGVALRELATLPWAGDAERRLEAAQAAVEARDAGVARALLDDAAGRGLAPWQRLRAGRLYQAAGAPESCARLLAPFPEHASDAAVCAALAGRPAEAESLAASALAARPGHLPAALTLGALLERRGKRRDAAKVYAAALEASPLPPEHELRRRAQRARLLALGRRTP